MLLDLDAKIPPTDFTFRFVIEGLHGKDERWDSLFKAKKLNRASADAVSGNGYLSFVSRLTFGFEVEEEPFCVILKVPTTSVFEDMMNEDGMDKEKTKTTIDDFAIQLVDFHSHEMCFYENVAAKSPLTCLPKVFSAKSCSSASELSSAYIIMEDLSKNGGTADLAAGLSKAQVEHCIRAIAEFHAFSLTLPSEILERLKVKPYASDMTETNFDLTLPKLLALKDSDYFRTHEKSMRKFLGSVQFPESTQFHEIFGTPPVLVHGDMWVNNIFFKKDAQGKVTDELCTFLDWQLARPDTGVGDLGHLILIGTSADLRKKHLDDWLRLYYDTFAASTMKWNVQNPYTLELVKRMFKAHYPSEFVFALALLAEFPEKTTGEQRKDVIDRMIAGFEVVRKDFE